MSFSAEEHLVNPSQLSRAFASLQRVPTEKRAFVPGGDPSMGGDPSGGGGAPPPGGDPSGGGMPPGGDPSGGGGAPPPGGAGDGGLMQMVTGMQQQIQQMQQGGGGMGMQAGGGAGQKNPLTPKIDEKAVMLQILKILARIVDHLKIPIPASEMVVNTSDMSQLAQASAGGGPLPGMDPTAGGGAPQPMPGAGSPGGMPPPGPEKMGSDRRTKKAEDGFAFDTSRLVGISNRAAAIARIQRTRAAA